MDAFLEFMTSPWGILIFAVVATAIIIFFLVVNYRLFTNVVLDFIFACIFILVLSPCIIACVIIEKKKTGSVFEKHWIVGKHGKLIQVHTFSDIPRSNGKLMYMSGSGIKYFPLLIDVLCGKMSLVGPSPVSVIDGVLMEDKYDKRFDVRPGIFSSACVDFEKFPDYDTLFTADCAYAAKYGLLGDIVAFFTYLIKYLRGESSGYLTIGRSGYAEDLANSGKITKEKYDEAVKHAFEETEKARRAPMRVG